LTLQSVNDATFSGQAPAPSKMADPALVRAEVLLDRANFKPGVIDGQMGDNVAAAIAAYAKAHGLPDARELTPQVWQALVSADHAPALKAYTLTAQDVAGPWSPAVGENFVRMSKLKSLGYTGPQEMLAERFHMDEGLLKALNPRADLGKAGTVIAVVDPGTATLPGPVARLEVDKASESVTAYGADDKVMAVFPATVGSTERPSPHGTWKIKGVAQDPDYVYDPRRLTWGPKRAGKLRIPPGPNNPVGVVWIALTAPDYGIHGTPDPRLVGKTASHGCVRLTNWDAEELSKAVKFGVKVDFLGGG
ncbi:MAG: L,D-transpeptidase, partial [Caulobacteraceae bacterium]